MAKRSEGRETWHRLVEWDKGQAASERLAGHVLRLEGFESIDPSHPLGGPDGGKDFFAVRNGKKWTGAVFFPRGTKSFSETRSKFMGDMEASLKNNSDGLIFITNQELTIGERDVLTKVNPLVNVEIFHLERIASLLDSPAAYGVRLEFLDIEMTKEDQISFFHWHECQRSNALIDALYEQNLYLTDLITGGSSYPRVSLPFRINPDKYMMCGSISVIGSGPLLDMMIQIRMNYSREGVGGTSFAEHAWRRDVSIPILYPNGFFQLEPWRVWMERNGSKLRELNVVIRARNGYFVHTCILHPVDGENYEIRDQVLYEVAGDEFTRANWRELERLPEMRFKSNDSNSG